MNNFSDFLDYYEKVRARTMKIVKCIPPDQMEWKLQEGKFSLGDIVRHLGAIERYMYAENVQGKPSKYKGCGVDMAEGYDVVLNFFETTHRESMEIFRSLSDEQVHGKCETPGGAKITVWKWLRLMAEHEIHHRGQLYTYLGVLGIKTPPIYGLTSEEVADRSV
ncbi:MAG: DinB family protein [Cyclobacteriaceae bacterium]